VKGSSFFQTYFGDGFRVVPFRKPLGGSLLSGVGGSMVVVKDKASTVVARKRLYVEALLGLGQALVFEILCRVVLVFQVSEVRRTWCKRREKAWSSIWVFQNSCRLYQIRRYQRHFG
jgi:hypothetical protein